MLFFAAMKSTRLFGLLLVLALFVLPLHLAAKVTHVEVISRADISGGKSFGDAGPYERITGRIYISLAIADEHNRRIVDLANAVNLKNGEVEFSADFVAIQPKDPAKGNGSMILESPNRGHSAILRIVDGGDWDAERDAGDAWLLRKGFTFVSLGWQWDSADGLKLYAPIAKENGKTITGLLRGDLMLSKRMDEIPLGHFTDGRIGGVEYPVANSDDPRNVLTVRDWREAPRTTIPRDQWQFAQTVDGKLQPSDRHIHLKGGFQAGKLYEYVYVVADPVVAGGAFAMFRDFVSYAKHAPKAITPAQRVYGQGISQNGRFLRDLLYQGFNADEDGRVALDGMLAHVAGAGRGSFNYRFAQPSRDAQPTSSVFFPTDIFPFTDQPETDPLTGETGGLLDVASKQNVIPKIFFSNTSYEYWGRVCALIHVTPDGLHDATISPNVRIYHFTGLQHFSGFFPPAKGKGDLDGQQLESSLPVRYFWRAMIVNMDAWVRIGIAPPDSSYPKIADGTLIPLEKYNPPAIPGLHRPHEATSAYRIDFGPNWRDGILSLQPPKVGQAFPVLVPAIDADGNERDGIRLPEISVPLASYLSWNLRDPSIGAPTERVPFELSFVPFPKTEANRRQARDPRRSIADRYDDREDYFVRFTDALDKLIQQRWILPEDRTAMLERGEKEWDLATAR
jgi:alpha/beta hydrolase family protein